ncbi:MAG: hypothetical protein M0Z33_11670 [Actinomycetota bacterium]|nr:hypothetical protein [Actinomycetota bacterium]
MDDGPLGPAPVGERPEHGAQRIDHVVGAEREPHGCAEAQLPDRGDRAEQALHLGVAHLALRARPGRGDRPGHGVHGNTGRHPEAQAETVSSGLDLEGDMSGTTEAPAGPGEHRVQVAPEAERSLRLDGSRHGHLDELAASGRTEASQQSDERGQDDERHEHAEDRHGHRRDSSGKVDRVVAEVVPPGAGVGEEPGEGAVGDARWGCGGDRGHGQGLPPVAGSVLRGARDRANASIEQGGLAPTSEKASGFETEEVDNLVER